MGRWKKSFSLALDDREALCSPYLYGDCSFLHRHRLWRRHAVGDFGASSSQVQQIEPMVDPVGALSVPSRDHQSSIFGGKSRTNITTIQALQLSPTRHH